jgi:hypothetical protein
MKKDYSEIFYVRGSGDNSVGIDGWKAKVEITFDELPLEKEEFIDSFKRYLSSLYDDGFRIEIETRTERDERERKEDEQWEAERAAALQYEPEILCLRDVFNSIFGVQDERKKDC